VKRGRIKKINELLKVYDGSSAASDLEQVKSLTEEKERLDKELDAERHLEDQVTSLATRLRNSRAKAKRLREEHAKKQLVIDELVAKQAVLQDSLAEAGAEVLQLLPKFAVNVQQLGELAVELGLDPSLRAELETEAKVCGRLHELPQAKPPAAQVQALAEDAAKDDMEINIELMESAELRKALEAAGLTQPDDAIDADMRVAHKRVLDSFTHAATAHKRKKK
ncbi:unnamed protein product, partial [Prorocentrum cordatum]